jgi:hypothetical protein
VHEGDAHLGLDALELDLHLSAQLEVEGAERLVEQQYLGAVDERPREGDPLLLAPGQLARATLAEGAELHELEHLLDLRADVLDTLAKAKDFMGLDQKTEQGYQKQFASVIGA